VSRVSGDRASYLVRAYEMGVEGAVPLVYRDIDLRDRPDHPGNRFNVVVDPETLVVIIGDEDSGVGDLARFAMGLQKPISGEAIVFGKRITDLSYYDLLVFRRRLGYLQVGDGLLQNLNLRDNVALPLRFASDHRLAEVDGKVTALVDQFHLRSVAHLRPAQANEEDRRRAAVARAIALDPELVVLEAPFDGLTTRAAQDLLEHVCRRPDGSRRTVVATVQDIVPSIRRMAGRVIRVVDGLAQEEAP
jgi:ABC-type transporter Mla maintaining outer membrane lipid asymmetry ATPase subunit MlaF